MTAADLARVEALAARYDAERLRWYATRDQPHSPRHHADAIMADAARTAYGAARMALRATAAR
jgi:hypothetical protein